MGAHIAGLDSKAETRDVPLARPPQRARTNTPSTSRTYGRSESLLARVPGCVWYCCCLLRHAARRSTTWWWDHRQKWWWWRARRLAWERVNPPRGSGSSRQKGAGPQTAPRNHPQGTCLPAVGRRMPATVRVCTRPMAPAYTQQKRGRGSGG